MVTQEKILLVTDSVVKQQVNELDNYGQVYWLDELSPEELDPLLGRIDAIFVAGFWPERLDGEAISQMKRLRFVQSFFAGVDYIPFPLLGPEVTVSCNAGGFSQEVAEHAWGLLLAAAKRIVQLDKTLRADRYDIRSSRDLGRDIIVLQGKTLGILGYGGIGRAVVEMGKAFGMEVCAFSRHAEQTDRVRICQESEGLLEVLGTSDAVVIALPLTIHTVDLIEAAALSAMKEQAILVNIARAEIINEEDLYAHLRDHPRFTYATDVWRIEGGRERFSSRFPLLELDNFIGTPHVAGWPAVRTGGPVQHAVQNLARFLAGKPPAHVVNPAEYLF